MVYFFCVVLSFIPVSMISCGVIWMRLPPSDVNPFTGYRTVWSQKSVETWKYAHKFAGRIWLWEGILLLIASPMLLYFFRRYEDNQLGFIALGITAAQLFFLCLCIVPTELSLRKHFNEEGKPKNLDAKK